MLARARAARWQVFAWRKYTLDDELFVDEAAGDDDEGDANNKTTDLKEDAGPAALLLQLREQVGGGDVEEAAGADGEQERDVVRADGTGVEHGGQAEEAGDAGERGEAQGAARREMQVHEDGEVAAAVGDLVERDGEGGDPADPRAGEEGDADGGSIDEAVEHAGEHEAEGARAVAVVMVAVVMGVRGCDFGFGRAAGEREEEAFDSEEREHGTAEQRPGASAVTELGDCLWEQMQQGGGEQDSDGEGDDEGELAAEETLARAQEPGGADGGGLHGEDSQHGANENVHSTRIMHVGSQ